MLNRSSSPNAAPAPAPAPAGEPPSAEPLLKVHELKKHYPIRGGLLNITGNTVKAVDNISFHIRRGEVLGVVGESGCGKSTVGLSLLNLEVPTSGRIWYKGREITALSKREMRRCRRDMQLIFQDPLASLNPRKTIEQTIIEPLDIFRCGTRRERLERAVQVSEEVGISRDMLDRLPHEFSGGQRQRICIARALALRPSFIVADEAVSALDVSIQAQVINLMKRLKDEYQLTYLFISHDMRVIEHVSDRVMVMYLGGIVEFAEKKTLFKSPRHPYTQALLSAVPQVVKKNDQVKRIILKGDVGSPVNVPSGCRFHPRCPRAESICREQTPEFRMLSDKVGAACHFVH